MRDASGKGSVDQPERTLVAKARGENQRSFRDKAWPGRDKLIPDKMKN